MGASSISISDAEFEKVVLKSDLPVVVDFWAEWCGPCKMMEPIFEEVGLEYSGRVKFVKINVDDNPESPAKYGVRGIPTMILFKDGDVVATRVGSLAKGQFTQFLDEHI